MKKIVLMSILAVAAVWARVASAEIPPELTYAFEDAAFQAAASMNASDRVRGAVSSIAFARLWLDEGARAQNPSENEALVIETALAATPGDLHFVVHAGHDADWKLIDEIFGQAESFNSWDPKTCPRLKELKLCDAILTAHLIGIYRDAAASAISVRIAMRLVQVATAEELWAGIVEGAYSNPGPDNERVSPEWRKALEACAADAVAKLPPSLDGYGLLVLPIDGRGGKAMGQAFLNALTAAGRQESIRVYDLPTGSASDRMLGRFLRERAGTGVALDDSVLRRIEKVAGGSGIPLGKLALMTGHMAVVSEDSGSLLDADGLPVDFTNGRTPAGAYRRCEVTTDMKFRDVNDHFRLIASIGASGVYEPPPAPPAPPPSAFDRFLEILGIDRRTFFRIVLGAVAVLVVLSVVVRIFKALCRAR